MKREAQAHWTGDIKTGRGRLSTPSGALDGASYGFASRFESGDGTNPEELIAAAHAGCYAMALSLELTERGLAPDALHASAEVTLEEDGDGFAIPKIALKVRGKMDAEDEAAFLEAAQTAKSNCPVSKLVKAEITLDAALG